MINHGNTLETRRTEDGVVCPEVHLVLSLSEKSKLLKIEQTKKIDSLPQIPPFQLVDWSSPFAEYFFDSSSVGKGASEDYFVRSPTAEEKAKGVRIASLTTFELPRIAGRVSAFSFSSTLRCNYLESGNLGLAILTVDSSHGTGASAI